VLAGYVLLNHAPAGKNTWQTFDMHDMLGLDSFYDDLVFTPLGEMDKVGLTAPGAALDFGPAEIYQ
jgi:hypothetical protein